MGNHEKEYYYLENIFQLVLKSVLCGMKLYGNQFSRHIMKRILAETPRTFASQMRKARCKAVIRNRDLNPLQLFITRYYLNSSGLMNGLLITALRAWRENIQKLISPGAKHLFKTPPVFTRVP